MTEPFHVGVNYWPASSAMRWWRRFDRDEVDRDFARIRAAGGDLVRLFLIWEDFQPDPRSVSEPALVNLRTVADVAARHGLRVIPTLFTGHMSGVNFIPPWALTAQSAHGRFRVVSADRVSDRGLRSWYADGTVLAAQILHAREAARALAGHPALWGWDLGNENSNCCVPATRDDGLRWLDRIAGAIRAADARCAITLGLHMEDLEEDRRIGPAEAARVCDVLCMHGYPIYAAWARGPLDPELVAFLAELTRWLGGKDVLFAELGAPTRDGDVHAERIAGEKLLTEDEAASYLSAAFGRLHDAGTTGALAWCYADYDPRIWLEPPLDRAPHERHFGLWRADGRPKPAAAALGEWRARERAPAPEPVWRDEDRERFLRDRRGTLARLYEDYGRAAEVARRVL